MRTSASIVFLAACLVLAGMGIACGTSNNNGPTLTSIDISPISPSVVVGGTVIFSALGHYSDKTTADLTHQANWSSDNTAVATIAGVGTQPSLATGKSVGMANITVSFAQGSSSVQASTDLTVIK